MTETADDLAACADAAATVLSAAERGKMTPDAARVRSLMDSMRQVVDRAEAQLLARIPSVKP